MYLQLNPYATYNTHLQPAKSCLGAPFAYSFSKVSSPGLGNYFNTTRGTLQKCFSCRRTSKNSIVFQEIKLIGHNRLVKLSFPRRIQCLTTLFVQLASFCSSETLKLCISCEVQLKKKNHLSYTFIIHPPRSVLEKASLKHRAESNHTESVCPLLCNAAMEQSKPLGFLGLSILLPQTLHTALRFLILSFNIWSLM